MSAFVAERPDLGAANPPADITSEVGRGSSRLRVGDFTPLSLLFSVPRPVFVIHFWYEQF